MPSPHSLERSLLFTMSQFQSQKKFDLSQPPSTPESSETHQNGIYMENATGIFRLTAQGNVFRTESGLVWLVSFLCLSKGIEPFKIECGLPRASEEGRGKGVLLLSSPSGLGFLPHP